MSPELSRGLAGAVAGVSMLIVSGGLAQISAGDVSPAGVAQRQPAPVARAAERLISQILIREEPARAGYTRAKFPHWSDLDGDGCSTRQEILIDESQEGTIAGCEVLGGEWLSLYDAKVATVPGSLDIDHVVALAEAWDSGASAWTTERRQHFANDMGYDDSLIAVSAASNRAKSDKDPVEWLPPERSAWCRYATAWASVKVRWQLSADRAELDGLRRLFVTCRTSPPTRVPKAR